MTQLLSSRKVSAMQMTENVIPDGATVIPVDEYVIWLRCAELPNTYGSLANVIADTTAMETLCNNLNALRYMVRGGDVILPAVLANSSWVSALDGSAYAVHTPTMTSNTAPSGVVSWSWASPGYAGSLPWRAFDKNASTAALPPDYATDTGYYQYEFTETIWIYKVKYDTSTLTSHSAKNPTLSVSSDGTAFTNIVSQKILSQSSISNHVRDTNLVTGSGKYARVSITENTGGSTIPGGFAELEFYGLDLS